jgi:hypothetical protein
MQRTLIRFLKPIPAVHAGGRRKALCGQCGRGNLEKGGDRSVFFTGAARKLRRIKTKL